MLRPYTGPEKAIRKAAGGIAAIAGAGLAAAAGWTAYSALFINHDEDLPHAIDANRYVAAGPLSGRLSFYADESAEGRPLLLIHSINAAASSYEMRPLFEHFRSRRPVFALDLPGFGFSERGERDYTPELFSQAILDFISSELGASEVPDVVAYSLSCEFAAVAARQQPNAFRSLTFIAPTGFGNNSPSGGDIFHRAITFPVWSQAFYDLIVTPASIDYFLRKVFAGEPDPEFARYSYLTSHRPGARHAPLAFLSGRLFSPDIRETYAALEQPVLAFCDLGDFGPSDELPHFASEHPNWQTICPEGTKAIPQFEQRAATMQALEAFFEYPGRAAMPWEPTAVGDAVDDTI